MSAIHTNGEENKNLDLIAMLSELEGLDSIEEPDNGLADVVEMNKSTITTDDLFGELLPLVSASKPEKKGSEVEEIAELFASLDDEIKMAPIVEESAAAVLSESAIEEPKEEATPEPEKKAEEQQTKEKREPTVRRKRFSLDQLSDEVMAGLGFERKSFMDGYNACPVKAMDKVQNVMAWSQGLAELSVYTVISVTHLINSGTSDTAGFRLAMMSNPEKPYPSSTASAQAGQMMSILPVLGMATKEGKMLTLNQESPLVKKFKSEAM